MQKFAIPGAKSHSNIGNASLDERIRAGGCRQERMYDSVQGAMNGMVGGMGGIGDAASQLGGLQSLTNQFVGNLGGGGSSGSSSSSSGGGSSSGGSSSGGSSSSSSSKSRPESGRGSVGDGSNNGLLSNNTLINKTINIGFGGLNGGTDSQYTTQLCEDSKTKKEKAKKEKIKQDRDKDKWKSTNFCIDRNVNRLKGEKDIDGKTTQNSRVCLFKQKNKTENGIWITSKGEWKRAEDANHPKEFIPGREIVTCNKTIEYVGKKNPVIDEDDLTFKEKVKDPDKELIEYAPPGKKGRVVNISVPSGDEESAKNFNNGTPNQVVVVEPGEEYHFDNGTPNNFPSIFIPGYNGTPVPVVDRESGEMVAILTNPNSYDPNFPQAGVGIIADTNPNGLTTDDPDYDIVLGGVFVGNTGFDYGAGKDNRNSSTMNQGEPIISIIDKDTGMENGKVKATVVSGRIVDVEIINSGRGFLRIPEVKIKDKFGFGAQLYPVMSIVPRPQAKPFPVPVKMVFCPGKGQVNAVPKETPRQVTGVEVMQNFDSRYVPTANY